MSRMADTQNGGRRRQFDEEFKAGAVRLGPRGGARRIGAVARKLDLTASALRHWVKHAQGGPHARARTGLTTAEREELARLRKENRILLEERDILKDGHAPRRTHVGMKVVASACASEPGQGRRLLVPRARKKMDPSAAPQAPRTVARLPSGVRSTPGKLSPCGTPRRATPLEVRTWRCSTPAAVASMSTRRRWSPACGVQDGRRRHTEVQSFGTTTAEILRLHALAVGRRVHPRRDGIDRRLLAAGLQSARGQLRRGARQRALH